MTNMIGSAVYTFLIMVTLAVLIAARINYKRTKQNPMLVALCIGLIAWLTADLAVLLIYNISINIIISSLAFTFISLVSVALFLVVFQFALPERKLSKSSIILLLIIPTITTILAVTSNSHQLLMIIESFTVWPRYIEYTIGIWLTVHAIYSFALAISSIIIMLYTITKKSISNRTSSIVFIVALVVALLGNLLYMLGATPYGIDPTSIGTTIAVLLFHMALSDGRYGMVFRLFNTLKSRITFPIILVMTLTIIAMVGFVARTTRIIIEDNEKNNIASSAQAIQTHLSALEQQTFLAAIAMGDSTELIRLIREGDREALWQFTYDRKRYLNVDEIIIGSAYGYTLARSHIRYHIGDMFAYGDDISQVPSVAAALRGETPTFYSPTPTACMVMTSSAPIMDGSTLMGSVVVNFVVGHENFLDNIREIFGVDATVFRRDGQSVASTLVDPNTRDNAVGTAAREDIIETVIGSGQSKFLELNILGIPYLAYYFPLAGIDGNPNAMFFIGVSQEQSIAHISSQIRNIILIAILGVTTVSALMYILISKSLKPLGTLAENIKDVAIGNMNVNIDRTKITTDEIGMLTTDVCGLVDTLNNIVEDFTNVYVEYITIGNVHYNVDDSKYQNSYKEIVGLINTLLTKNTTDILHVTKMLEHISDGNFDTNIQLDDWKGDWAIMPNTVISLTNSLKSVSTEVGQMIEAAAVKGDMSFEIDPNKYKGDWREIMMGLNRIAKTVDEPLKCFAICLNEMRVGNFDINSIDKKIAAQGLDPNATNYNGVFKVISNAIDSTVADISSYVNELEEILAKTANGDLRNKINRDYVGSFDLIKHSVNNINATLHKTMSEISVSAQQVLVGTNQISSSATDLASGAQQQAGSVQELNAAIDIINQQTIINAKSALKANEVSGKSATNAQEGNEAMKQTLEAMTQIKESSNNIFKIIKTIQDIAFQTNLLSLNASVEAARAGEQGKGFSVVAEEVRTLAGRSQIASNETTTLIQGSIEHVETGSNIAESTYKSLDAIVASSVDVAKIVDTISTASKEQAEAIGQVSVGLEEIAKITQTNSAVAEETAAATEELTSQAELLRQLVAYFKL